MKAFLTVVPTWVFALATLVSSSGDANGSTVLATDWWTNSTASLNVFNPGGTGERVRLGNFTSGFIEGSVILPFSHTWNIAFAVSNDVEPGIDETDFVRVYLNGGLIGDFTNTEVFNIAHQISGPSFSFRFEFASSNSHSGFHQIVNAGTVTSIPEPAPHMLLMLGLGSVLVRWRSRSN